MTSVPKSPGFCTDDVCSISLIATATRRPLISHTKETPRLTARTFGI